MNYEIILSPDLDIKPAEFVAAWNDTSEARTFAHAHLITAKGAQFDPTLIISIMITVTTAVTANVLSDQINILLKKHKGPKVPTHTHIEYEEKKDGSKRFIIDTE